MADVSSVAVGATTVGANHNQVTASMGVGPITRVVTMSKSSITNAESLAAIRFAEGEGNVVAGVIKETNVHTLLLQGAGITDGANYGVGSTGVTAATTLTFTQ
jgi:hypothetical protein